MKGDNRGNFVIDFKKSRYSLEFSVYGDEIIVDNLRDLISQVSKKVEAQKDNGCVKVIAETDEPEVVLSLCARIGKLARIKVEDLRI